MDKQHIIMQQSEWTNYLKFRSIISMTYNSTHNIQEQFKYT